MTTDTGKHSALRQTSDGSFEVVYETGGLHEVSEDEANFSEAVSTDAPRLAPRPSTRTLVMIAVGACALLATVAIVAVVTSDSVRDSTPGEELPVVPGFKPYGGSGDSRAAVNRARTPRPQDSRAAAALLDELEAEDAEEQVAEEPGWEVQEELPPEIVADELIPEEVIEDEMADEGEDTRTADPRLLRMPRDLAPRAIGRPVDKLPVPNLPVLDGARGMRQQRMERLPIRGLQQEEVQEEELPGEEVVEEEYPVEEELPVEEGGEEGDEAVGEEEMIEEEEIVEEY